MVDAGDRIRLGKVSSSLGLSSHEHVKCSAALIKKPGYRIPKRTQYPLIKEYTFKGSLKGSKGFQQGIYLNFYRGLKILTYGIFLS